MIEAVLTFVLFGLLIYLGNIRLVLWIVILAGIALGASLMVKGNPRVDRLLESSPGTMAKRVVLTASSPFWLFPYAGLKVLEILNGLFTHGARETFERIKKKEFWTRVL